MATLSFISMLVLDWSSKWFHSNQSEKLEKNLRALVAGSLWGRLAIFAKGA
jgi:hypothetical protein